MWAIFFAVVVVLVSSSPAQWGRGRRQRRAPDRSEYPTWTLDEAFAEDAFTFARVRFRAPWTVIDGRWDNDYPDGDWNFSYRLQELTAMDVAPDGHVVDLTDPDLGDFPFLYMVGIRDLEFQAEEVDALRKYLLNGGFLMVDDFWAPQEWRQIRRQMQRVFPRQEPRELSLSHPIFHMVYDISELPQVPSIQAWRRGWRYEHWHGNGRGDEGPHFWGITDDRDRLMVLLCHNNDIGDGWEREGEETEYFHEYAERWSYPMGINIITYAMTH